MTKLKKLLIPIILAIKLNALITFETLALTNLTFTAHPTNTKLSHIMHDSQKEIEYYHNQRLYNLMHVLLHEGNNELKNIGNFYNWIGLDFDRSNLKAHDIVYTNIRGIDIMRRIYAEYNQDHLNNNSDIANSLTDISHYTKKLDNLIQLVHDNKISLTEFLENFEFITKSFNLENIENKIITKLDSINNIHAEKLSIYFKKFKFQPFRGQIRFDGHSITNGNYQKDIFKIISIINNFQNYAISDIIIANFSSIDEVKIIKELKHKYNITNISTIPLLESQTSVDYTLANLDKIIAEDKISQIMKAGSDDTKFSGLASSILSFARVGQAIENLKTDKKPILFIGMGSSIERLGGPIFFRKMLASLIGNNETNRTIQGGELEHFATTQSTINKIKNEIDISKTPSNVKAKDIEEISQLFNNEIGQKYQMLHEEESSKNNINSLLNNSHSPTNFAYILDNFQAGSRYKRKLYLDEQGKLVNKFNDLFEDTRAIDFQTSFVLSGIHPEFALYNHISDKEISQLSSFKDNKILQTYITAMILIHKQTHIEYYNAIGLPEDNIFYNDFISGSEKFIQLVDKDFIELKNDINYKLSKENYLDYSDDTKNKIINYLTEQKNIIEKYNKGIIKFDALKDKLLELNYKISNTRNLLNVGNKN